MSKTALVTGGNSGIGFATAKLLSDKGYKVVITGRDYEKVKEVGEELKLEYLIADIANLDEVEGLSQRFTGSGLDILVNNAAIAKFMPISQHTEEDYELFFNTNIRAPLALIQKLLPALEKRQGSITTVSSIVTTNGLANASLYAATKGAVDAFTRSLAVELSPHGIRINAVSPGGIDTPILSKLGLTEEIKEKRQALIPLGRYGKPDEVASVIVSQLESSYVTGAIWTVDGGVDAV